MDNIWIYKNKKRILDEKTVAGVPYLFYPLLETLNMVNHGFSTRLGGVSKEMWATMNLSFSRGDDAKAVRENFRRMAQAIGTVPEHLVFSAQTHTTNIRCVTMEDQGKGFTKPLDYCDVDGLVTNVPGLCLATFYADCVPLFLVDPVKKAIGLVHSGWRGTVGKIGAKAIQMMGDRFGTDPLDIRAAVGPSICQDCYEVCEDVILAFGQQFTEEQMQGIALPKEGGKYQLNLWRANEIILKEAGIQDAHLAVTNLCTCCNHELLFSHRASHGKRGNLGAFLELR